MTSHVTSTSLGSLARTRASDRSEDELHCRARLKTVLFSTCGSHDAAKELGKLESGRIAFIGSGARMLIPSKPFNSCLNSTCAAMALAPYLKNCISIMLLDSLCCLLQLFILELPPRKTVDDRVYGWLWGRYRA
jgi:hypothetical protein